MFYLDIIFIICFLNSNPTFAPYKAYALLKYYLSDNVDCKNIDSNKDKQIYREMDKSDFC